MAHLHCGPIDLIMGLCQVFVHAFTNKLDFSTMVHHIIERPNLQNKVSTENLIYHHLGLKLFEEVQ